SKYSVSEGAWRAICRKVSGSSPESTTGWASRVRTASDRSAARCSSRARSGTDLHLHFALGVGQGDGHEQIGSPQFAGLGGNGGGAPIPGIAKDDLDPPVARH